MKSNRRPWVPAAWLSLLGLLAGCARAPSPEAPTVLPAPNEAASPTATPASPAEEPRTLAEAEAQLEQARAEFDRLALEPLALNEAAGAPSPARAAPAQAPAPSLRKATARDEAPRADKAASAAQSEPPPKTHPDGCETACKAFSSLARASDAVCRLDTDGGRRCQRARQIREDAERRVAGCGCSQ